MQIIIIIGVPSSRPKPYHAASASASDRECVVVHASCAVPTGGVVESGANARAHEEGALQLDERVGLAAHVEAHRGENEVEDVGGGVDDLGLAAVAEGIGDAQVLVLAERPGQTGAVRGEPTRSNSQRNQRQAKTGGNPRLRVQVVELARGRVDDRHGEVCDARDAPEPSGTSQGQLV